MSAFIISVTLEVEAGSPESALTAARVAAMTLEPPRHTDPLVPRVVHAWIDRQATEVQS